MGEAKRRREAGYVAPRSAGARVSLVTPELLARLTAGAKAEHVDGHCFTCGAARPACAGSIASGRATMQAASATAICGSRPIT